MSVSQDSSRCLEQQAVSDLDQRGILNVVECGGETLSLRQALEILEICDYIVRRKISGLLYGLRCGGRTVAFIHLTQKSRTMTWGETKP